MTQERTHLKDHDRVMRAIRQQLARTPEAPDSDIALALKDEGLHAPTTLIREVREEMVRMRKQEKRS